MPHEQKRLLDGGPGIARVLRLEHVSEQACFAELSVSAAEAVSGEGERAAAEEFQGVGVDPGSRPLQRFAGALGETISVKLAAQRRVMVAHYQVIRVRVRGFENLGRVRAIPDDIPEAEFYSPGLTTLRQDFDEVGRRSVELLIDMIENGLTPAEPPLLEPTLMVRGSAAPPTR